jgi:hypothetical protein
MKNRDWLKIGLLAGIFSLPACTDLSAKNDCPDGATATAKCDDAAATRASTSSTPATPH